jgi:MFS family permease
MAIAAAERDPSVANVLRWLGALFLTSGAAALIYQVAWQRLLFQAFGADIESVTIIVSAFMLGLGCGALAGGQVADRFPERALLLFAVLELATGAFGFCSPFLIRAASTVAVNGSLAEIAAVNFLLLLLPTTLMGATLPILVAHVVRRHRSVGVSIGTLYFANTIGAALGAGVAGFLALYFVGLRATIQMAALLNVAVSAAAFLVFRGRRG